ncbi:Zinc/iron permease [Cordyceps fumosorosea ARSEF 2679]|uniref:Zinc/iron permease n=1 Tax=Cordyceps fumosorosea (strain ARSEF 2679) TaxID=1081104 RepID=A0A168EC07_CORFA|nr:Zinc/iron permease [Cordyceps fumosorosea ARSEF 2679]OAA73630.1 Zinc/iron permease [Cordyceps fumosorosea ARSEF 2679]
MIGKTLTSVVLWAAAASAASHPMRTPAPDPAAAAAATTPTITAVTDCHLHGSDLYCVNGATEYHMQTTPTQTTDLPASFTGCHPHGTDLYCFGPGGDDILAKAEGGEPAGDKENTGEAGGNLHCHSHAGVEHCVGDGAEEGPVQCDAPKRSYNIGLRVGLLFVILATSALGVFGPLFLQRAMGRNLSLLFTFLKQFGTGIVISTAFVHLYTHATLMFENKCLGNLGYEGVTSAIVMAGLFLSFIVEYIGHRIVLAKEKSVAALSMQEKSQSMFSVEVVTILVLEAGILFHSLLIGLTLVVAADQYFITLFIVIVFHQVFEGLALGTRIATIGTNRDAHSHAHAAAVAQNGNAVDATSPSNVAPATSHTALLAPQQTEGLSLRKKLGLASLFAFVTPLGMAIGIGVLNTYNGKDPATIIAIGTLDAVSAGILIWVGVVEMWAGDWMLGSHGNKAELADAKPLTVGIAGFGLIGGLVVMSVLGKWA